MFILFGLSVVSAAINLLVLRFLTLNTEDERRDEAAAALTAAGRVHLEGDVITGNECMPGDDGVSVPGDGDNADVVSVCSCTCYGNPRGRSFLPDYGPGSGSRRRKSLLKRESSSLMMMTVAGPETSSGLRPSNASCYARKGSTFSTASAAPAYYRQYADDQEDGQVLAIEEEDLPSASFDLDDFNEPPDPHYGKQGEADCELEEEEDEFAQTFHYTNSSFNYSSEASESNNNYRERQRRAGGPHLRSWGHTSRQQVSRDSNDVVAAAALLTHQKRTWNVVSAIHADTRERRWHRYVPSAILRSMSSGRQSSDHELSRRTTGQHVSRDRQLITSIDSEDGDHSRGPFHVVPHGRRPARHDRGHNETAVMTTNVAAKEDRALMTHPGDPDVGDEDSDLKRASI